MIERKGEGLRLDLVAVLLLTASLAGCVGGPGDGASSAPPTHGGDADRRLQAAGNGTILVDEKPVELAWVAHAAGPAPRNDVVGVFVDERIYVVGGNDGQNGGATAGTALVDYYDTRSNQWGKIADYPVSIHHSAAVGFGRAIFVMGGFSTALDAPTSLAFTFDVGAGSWTKLPDLPVARGAHTTALVHDRVYMIGGIGANGHVTTVDVLNLTTLTWSTAPDLPTPRDHVASAVLGSKIYVMGGSSPQGVALADVEVFDVAEATWTSIDPMANAREGFQGTTYLGQVLAVGGQASGGVEGTVEAYDPQHDAWVELPGMPHPREGHAVVANGDRVYALLGGTNQGLSGIVESLGPVGES